MADAGLSTALTPAVAQWLQSADRNLMMAAFGQLSVATLGNIVKVAGLVKARKGGARETGKHSQQFSISRDLSVAVDIPHLDGSPREGIQDTIGYHLSQFPDESQFSVESTDFPQTPGHQSLKPGWVPSQGKKPRLPPMLTLQTGQLDPAIQHHINLVRMKDALRAVLKDGDTTAEQMKVLQQYMAKVKMADRVRVLKELGYTWEQFEAVIGMTGSGTFLRQTSSMSTISTMSKSSARVATLRKNMSIEEANQCELNSLNLQHALDASMSALDLPDSESVLDTEMSIKFTIIFFLWLFSGIFWYHYYCKFTWIESFYYTVQAGLSVGFGLIVEPDDTSKAFTTFIVLMGSSFIGFCLGLLMDEMAQMGDKYVALTQELYKQIDGDNSGLIQLEELGDWCEQFMPGKMSDDEVQQLFNEIDVDGGGTIDVNEFKDYMLSGFGRRTSFEMFTHGVVDMWIPIFFISWMALGTIVGIVWWDFTFIQAVYFAVTACSTGGLEVAPRNDPAILFTGFYVLIGIPLYALSLTTAAAMMMQMIIAGRVEIKIFEAREQSKREVCRVLKDFLEDDSVSISEFIQLQLLRVKNISYEWVKEQEEIFRTIDKDGGGDLDVDELLAWDPGIQMYLDLMTNNQFMAGHCDSTRALGEFVEEEPAEKI